jgi:hypothetical protein
MPRLRPIPEPPPPKEQGLFQSPELDTDSVRLTDVNGETPSPKPLLLDTQVVEVDKSKEQLLPPEPDEATRPPEADRRP